jgi:hypothetical protein
MWRRLSGRGVSRFRSLQPTGKPLSEVARGPGFRRVSSWDRQADYIRKTSISAARPHFLMVIIRWARWTISSCKAKGGRDRTSVRWCSQASMNPTDLGCRSLYRVGVAFCHLKKASAAQRADRARVRIVLTTADHIVFPAIDGRHHRELGMDRRYTAARAAGLAPRLHSNRA